MKIKKGDIIISLGLLVLSMLMAFGISNMNTKSGGQILRIEKDSKLYGEFPLNVDREIVIDDDAHYNKVIIKDGKAYMQEANCRDQICTHMQEISINGETIICLPNRVFLEVIDTSNQDDGIDKVNR
ncbi:NusG domain II-containing protein [Anaerococcus sp. mt242]|mgnify:FL=1|uniref:NusG domain II-containing protein n=1 Tax=unclassified Anaerococcus TaxID=2614126 RepID=UPI001931ECF6|nr:NusG domain II-containing protein [Anaerococcus sp. mt242]MBM0045928.1 NusG domain II-containing protein [Anaerococcus sp. mt242]